jgi:hypothetical protein
MKTSELQGAALDWAVARCEGYTYETDYYPSKNWELGGPIIERVITKIEDYGDSWGAEGPNAPERFGQTPLIAAMRCYVASKLGDEIELPEELR